MMTKVLPALAMLVVLATPVQAAPVRAKTPGDRGATAAMLALGAELHTLADPMNWSIPSGSMDARAVEVARVATMRRLLHSLENVLSENVRRSELGLSGELQGAIRLVINRVRVASVNARFTTPQSFALVLSQVATDIAQRFDARDAKSPASGKLSFLKPNRAVEAKSFEVAAEAYGRVIERAVSAIQLMTILEEDPTVEIRHYLSDSAMPAAQLERAGDLPPQAFWSGVDSLLRELAFAMSDTASRLRPEFTGKRLPGEYVGNMQLVWRILSEAPARPPTADASRWFPGREKLRTFGRPARCERALTQERFQTMQLELDAQTRKALPATTGVSGERPEGLIEIDPLPRRFEEGVSSPEAVDAASAGLEHDFIL